MYACVKWPSGHEGMTYSHFGVRTTGWPARYQCQTSNLHHTRTHAKHTHASVIFVGTPFAGPALDTLTGLSGNSAPDTFELDVSHTSTMT